MKKMKIKKARVLLSVLLACTIFLTSGTPVKAVDKVNAGEKFSGTWEECYGNKVKFTRKYCRYYTKKGKYIRKAKIISVKETSYGYFIKMKQGKRKCSYRFYNSNVVRLKYYGSWSKKRYYKYKNLLKKTLTSTKEARAYIKQYLKDKKQYVPDYIECCNYEKGKWNFHGYDDMGDHIATSFWYTVSKKGKIHDDITGKYVKK